MSKVLIDNLPSFEKETEFGGQGSGAILNKDENGLSFYKKQKLNLHRIDKLENEIHYMKNDISQILEILKSNN